MRDMQRATSVLPRLMAPSARFAAMGNGVGLLATALLGAGLVHLLAYHIPLDTPFGPLWFGAAAAWLEACPLLVWIGVIAVFTVAISLIGVREFRRLSHLDSLLRQRFAQSYTRSGSPAAMAAPRRVRRLTELVCIVVILQYLSVWIIETLAPMRMHMIMDGVPMTMAMTPTLPLIPVHIVVATLLGILLWRVEHRMLVLRARVAHRLRMLAGVTPEAIIPPILHRIPSSRAWYGPVLFARPPPPRVALNFLQDPLVIAHAGVRPSRTPCQCSMMHAPRSGYPANRECVAVGASLLLVVARA